MNKKKMAMSITSVALVGAVVVGGTLAYLSDKSNMVTNTFNVGSGYTEEDGHIGLWLDEKDVANPGERTEIGNEYEELLPGSIVEKDPTFHLTTGSTDSYVFAQVSGVDAMIEAGYFFTVEEPDKLVDPENAFNGKWVKVSDGDEVDPGFGRNVFDGLYIYVDGDDGVVSGGEAMEPMFNWVKLGSGLDNEKFEEITPSAVDIRGVAVQSANLTADEAQVEAEKILATMPY
ncbi:TasA family protein [Allofournierella massiliensis]|uniref:TasA family protein n=1 Tax=Allofournierella massiliensis TaxID=1650663 RepID=A0ABT7URK4_9FIRM|nr:TasA family protein [Fournierella massiliensis]MDM8201526.1 TasA family protein [Fournierella massiliensis]